MLSTACMGKGNLGKVYLRSFDPDGDGIDIRWWQVPEAGFCMAQPEIIFEGKGKSRVVIPDGMKGCKLHFVCEVTYNGDYNLRGYRRVIINVK